MKDNSVRSKSKTSSKTKKDKVKNNSHEKVREKEKFPETQTDELDFLFDHFEVSDSILKAIDELEFLIPTHIQSVIIPKMLESSSPGKNHPVLVKSNSSTGRTMSYLIPVLEMIQDAMKKKLSYKVLVVAHDNEEKLNIIRKAFAVSSFLPEVEIKTENEKSKKRQSLVVSSFKNFSRLIGKRDWAEEFDLIVFDDADRSFLEDKKEENYAVFECLSDLSSRIYFFSSSFPNYMMRLFRDFEMDYDPVCGLLSQASLEKTNSFYYYVKDDKTRVLDEIFDDFEIGQAVVFCQSKSEVEEVSSSLVKLHNLPIVKNHEERSLKERKRIFDDFIGGKARVLVTNDFIDRTLDFGDIDTVINYSVPESLEQYSVRGGTLNEENKKEGWRYIINISNKKEKALLENLKSQIKMKRVDRKR